MHEKKHLNFNKLKWLEHFQGEIEQVGLRLENSGTNNAQELKKLYDLLQERVRVSELSELGSDIQNLSQKTFYALKDGADKDEVYEGGTKLLMNIEKLIQREKQSS